MDLLDAYSAQKENREYRKFWLQYRRFAYQKDTLDRASLRKIIKKNGVNEVAHFFRRELDALAKTPSFGQYKQPTTGGFGQEDTDGSLDFLQGMVPDAQKSAPYLMRFLGLLSKPAHKRDEIDPIPGPPQLVWASMFLYMMRRKKCNNIPKLIGLYCVNGGVKKSIVDILSRLGLCVSYTTIQECLKSLTQVGQKRLPMLVMDPTSNFAHDNFDFSEQPSGERLGQRKTFVSLTNGIIFQGLSLPKDGLQQSSWHPERPLSAAAILHNIANDPNGLQVNYAVYS